jgi:hypothetical protein
MDSRINSVHVAQCFLEPMPYGFQYYELVVPIDPPQGECDAKLERHVKTNWQSHPAQVMDGNRTGPNEAENPNEPAIALFRHLEHTPWRTSNCHQHANQRDKQRFVRGIEWNVDEDTSPSDISP